jgi:hypothetical protein
MSKNVVFGDYEKDYRDRSYVLSNLGKIIDSLFYDHNYRVEYGFAMSIYTSTIGVEPEMWKKVEVKYSIQRDTPDTPTREIELDYRGHTFVLSLKTRYPYREELKKSGSEVSV